MSGAKGHGGFSSISQSQLGTSTVESGSPYHTFQRATCKRLAWNQSIRQSFGDKLFDIPPSFWAGQYPY